MSGLVLSLLAVLGCDEPDPLVQPAANYAATMRGLMVENAELEQNFVDLSGALHQEGLTPEEITTALEDELIPGAVVLEEKAAAATPSAPELAILHSRLEKAWGDRTRSWRAIQIAFEGGDLDGLQTAMDQRTESREAEMRYLLDADALLRPYGESVPRYP
ncbi:MAG: hypothetical protein ACI8RZ_007689 [Myxococcota bacterium]|jgi:hypothetical protein